MTCLQRACAETERARARANSFSSLPGYPKHRGVKCDMATDEEGNDAFPYCLGKLAAKRYLYFGGDPIGTVAIAEVPLYGG